MLTNLIAAWVVVVSIANGATLTVRENGRTYAVRLAQVAAPPMQEAMSVESRISLDQLCSKARLVYVDPVEKLRDGTMLAHVWCDGVHVNMEQVAHGLAWCVDRGVTGECRTMETVARKLRRGLWSEAETAALAQGTRVSFMPAR